MPELQRLSVTVEVLRVGVMIVGVISVGVMTVGVLSVGVMTVGVISVGVMTVGVLSVGVMALSRENHLSQTLSHNAVSSTPRHVRCSNSQL